MTGFVVQGNIRTYNKSSTRGVKHLNHCLFIYHFMPYQYKKQDYIHDQRIIKCISLNNYTSMNCMQYFTNKNYYISNKININKVKHKMTKILIQILE